MLRQLSRLATLAPLAHSLPSTSLCLRSYSSADTSTSQKEEEYEWPKLVVFGGRGFVGSAICQEAVKSGLQVVSISPSGTPPLEKDPWVQQVIWARGSALEPRTYQHHLEGSIGAISCVGAFGSQAHMLRINGEANRTIIETAAATGVPRFVYISAHIPNIPIADQLIKGYIQGKKAAEEALFAAYPKDGVALRPSFIYGNRHVTSSLTIPLQLVGAPWKALLGYLPPQAKDLASLPFVGAAVIPPVSVEAVAKVAVQAATDPSVPGGIIDVWDIAKH